MEDNKRHMTIYFKKKSLEIDRVITGIQDNFTIYPLTLEEMDIIYGKMIMEYDEYIFNNKRLFKIVEKDGEYSLDMKEEYKSLIKQFT